MPQPQVLGLIFYFHKKTYEQECFAIVRGQKMYDLLVKSIIER